MAAQRFSTLDGARGVAALAVVLLHLQRPGFHVPPSTYTAVDLFFLMSGFVIAGAYGQKIPLIGAWGFIRARVIRLYPAFLAGMLILPAYFLVRFLQTGHWFARPAELLASLGAGLLFLPSRLASTELWEGRAIFPLNVPAWSLMYEVAANLVYALFLRWLSKPVLLAIVLVSAAVLVASHGVFNGLDVGWSWDNALWGLPRVGFSFFLGVLIHRLRIPRPDVPPLMLLAAIVLLFFAPPLLAVMVGFPLVLIAATRPDAGREHRVMAAMGALSYPLYVVHFPLLHWTRLFVTQGLKDWWVVPVTLVIVLPCAWVVLKLWDEPIRRRLSRRRAQAEAAASA